MSVVIRAILSMTVAIAAVVAVATVASTLADVLGGIVALAAMLVFTRTIMDLASAAGDEPPDRPNWPR
jgi:L-lactate permease